MAIRGRGSKKISPSTAHWSVLGPGRAVFLQPLEEKKGFVSRIPNINKDVLVYLRKAANRFKKKMKMSKSNRKRMRRHECEGYDIQKRR